MGWKGNSCLEMLHKVSDLGNLDLGVSLLQGMESVRPADASASGAGKGIAASAHLHLPTQRLFTLMSIESIKPSNHLILCRPLLLLLSIFPSFRVFSNESGLFQ